MVSRAYEDELKRLEDRERVDMAKERARLQGTVRPSALPPALLFLTAGQPLTPGLFCPFQERDFREAVQKDLPRVPKPSQAFSSPKASHQQRPSRARHLTPYRARPLPRKPALSKLLPVLQSELEASWVISMKHSKLLLSTETVYVCVPVKVKDNDLLPLLLEEFPHLQISPHTLTRMWKKQLKQVDHLAAVGNHHTRNKLTSQVGVL